MVQTDAADAGLRFNPLDPRLISNPYTAYDQLRSTEPVHWNELLKVWVLTGYEDVRSVLSDPAFRSIESGDIVNEIARRVGRDWSNLSYVLDSILFFKEGPIHERDRRTIAKVVNRHRLSDLDPTIVDMARKLAEPLHHRQSFDMLAEFAEILPQQVMALILDLPMEDVPTLARSLGELTLVFDAASIDTYDRANTEVTKALALISERIENAAPDSNLRIVYDGCSGDDAEKLRQAAAIVLWVYRVGAETTIGLLGLMAKALIDQPELRDALLADRSLIDTVVSEQLRLEATVQRVGRLALEPRRLSGVDIAAGDRLLVCIGAANRDPAAFRPADRVGTELKQPPDLAFGAGKHFCLGASLARLEGRIALAALLDLPKLELAGDPVWFGGRTIRRLSGLPVRRAADA